MSDYKLQEGLDALDRIKLLMEYDMSKSFSENKSLIEQDEKFETQYNKDLLNAGEKEQEEERNKKENEKNTFLKKIKQYPTPYDDLSKSSTITVPLESKVSNWTSNDDRQKSIFGSWFGSGWQEYIPKEDYLKKLLPDNTLRSFTTPDNIKYTTFLKRISDNPPYYYNFIGFKDKDGNPYIQTKYLGETPESLKKGGWWSEHWVLMAQLAVSLGVAIATGGQSLIVQAIAQLGVDVAFASKQLVDGDNVGALISLVIGLVPVIGRLSKFGTKLPIEFLRKYGSELSKINDPKTMSLFYESLKGEEKILMSRIVKQTPGELKKMADEGMVNAMKKAVENKTIDLSKIPQSQRLWWKQMGVEPAVGLGGAVGVTYTKSKIDQSKLESDAKSGSISKEKIVYTQDQIENSFDPKALSQINDE
jgi:hypothetical protein